MNDENDEMQAALGYDEKEEVSSEIRDLRSRHEKDTIPLCPMEEIHVKIDFLKQKYVIVNLSNFQNDGHY